MNHDSEDFRHVGRLGMGGSNPASEVYQRTFCSAPRHPELLATRGPAPLETALRA